MERIEVRTPQKFAKMLWMFITVQHISNHAANKLQVWILMDGTDNDPDSFNGRFIGG